MSEELTTLTSGPGVAPPDSELDSEIDELDRKIIEREEDDCRSHVLAAIADKEIEKLDRQRRIAESDAQRNLERQRAQMSARAANGR